MVFSQFAFFLFYFFIKKFFLSLFILAITTANMGLELKQPQDQKSPALWTEPAKCPELFLLGALRDSWYDFGLCFYLGNSNSTSFVSILNVQLIEGKASDPSCDLY